MRVADWPHGLPFSGWGVLLGRLPDGFLGLCQVNRCVRWRETVGWQNKREGWKSHSLGWGRVYLVTWPTWQEVAMGSDFPEFGHLRVCLQDTSSPVFQMSTQVEVGPQNTACLPLFLSFVLLLPLPSHSYFFPWGP